MPIKFLLLSCLATMLISGCKPWVKPYEREKLSDPIMALERNDVDGKTMGHVYGAREGGKGAESGAGGGCGCN